MTISDNIELPKLTADEAWLDKSDTDLGLSEADKRLLYLPHIAYKTVLYNNSNELSEYQKDRLLLLFRGEAEQAFNAVHNHVLLTVGNAPTDRLEYFKDFESWKERLVEVVKKSLDCITKEQFLKEIKEITNTLPSKEQLAIEGKLTTKGTVTVEGKNQLARILDNLTKRGKEKVFVEHIYFTKFSHFIIEALHLLRRFSVMYSITTERTEWMIKGLENIGQLPENVKIALEKIRNTTQGKAGQGKTAPAGYKASMLFKVPVSKLIKCGEGHTVEFKETLEWDVKRNEHNRNLNKECLETIAAFLNTDGGTLLIGVKDNGEVTGIERDLPYVQKKNHDGFQQKLRSLIRSHFAPHPFRKVKVSFEKLAEGTVCRIDVSPANPSQIIYLDNEV